MSDQLFNQADFSRRLRVRMAERGIDQKTCATEASVSKSSLSRICSLTMKPSVENYLRLSAWLRSVNPEIQDGDHE